MISDVVRAFLALDDRDKPEAYKQIRDGWTAQEEKQNGQRGPSPQALALAAFRAYKLAREAVSPTAFESFNSNWQAFRDAGIALQAVATQRGCSLADVCRESAERYIADAWARDKSWPAGYWSRDPVKWLTATGVVDKATAAILRLEAQELDATQRGAWDEVERLRRDKDAAIAARRKGRR